VAKYQIKRIIEPKISNNLINQKIYTNA